MMPPSERDYLFKLKINPTTARVPLKERMLSGPAGRLWRILFLGMVLCAHVLTADDGIAADLFQHHLTVALDPEKHRLAATDRIKVASNHSNTVSFFLASHADIKSVTVNHTPVNAKQQRSGWLEVPLSSNNVGRPVSVTIQYEVTFNDPFPKQPVNFDNPGFGVVGTIGRQGTLLLAGAGWYPAAARGRETFYLEVTAPKGTIAVSAGASEGVLHTKSQTVSRWRIQYPIDALALSAGPYLVREKKIGRITAATYFFKQSNHLSATYLDAVEGYLKLYEQKFGPYPFDKFAVVENFFPTGYGFPSYTLLGSRVLQLPFIVRTSLGHEIAHCWWGNSVYIDGSLGNWAEGLTTYVADYFYKERTSTEAGLEYRRQMLRNYATLVPPEADFPLSQFRSRTDPVTKAVGYDKAAFVFHMLRKKLGEDHFWGGLRDVYRSKLFQRASWRDFQAAFENRSDRSLDAFFRQWVFRKGAPTLAVKDVMRERSPSGWRVTGILQQTAPEYEGMISVHLDSVDGRQSKSIRLTGRRTEFDLALASTPLRLSVDADFDFFRRLDATEIPPTVNALKSSRSVVVVFDDPTNAAARSAAATLTASLSLNVVGQIDARRLGQKNSLMDRHDLLVIGYPGRKGLMTDWPDSVFLDRKRFVVDGNTFEAPTDAFFGVFAHPRRKDRLAAIFLPMSEEGSERVARKITHYGKYSYLVFSRGTNRAKGYWPADRSPLIHQWPE